MLVLVVTVVSYIGIEVSKSMQTVCMWSIAASSQALHDSLSFQCISKCRDEELEHLDLGLEHDAEEVRAVVLTHSVLPSIL